ncbi:uncharacterized protein LOC142173698 [Nicotiana tabacum]|uniref:Uncharacterized protein LOC142173698 n=1 Tax=Nicotiana tabacum TaxID=4097 RepID=A0AC58TDX2_TOBAC
MPAQSTTLQAQSSQRKPTCASCGKVHWGQCRRENHTCYYCGIIGHVQRYCHKLQRERGSPPIQQDRSTPTTVTHPPVWGTTTQTGRVAGGILTICALDAYVLTDPGSTFSYVTPYFALDFEIESEQLLEPFYISTPVGDSVIASCVYKGYRIVVQDRETMTDLIKLEMIEFDAIMGMDWLSKCYASLDCRAKVVKFEFPNEPTRIWKGNILESRGRFISYLKAKKMIMKGCFYYFIMVTDMNAEVFTLESVPIVNEYLEIFPEELPSIPPD